MYPYYRINNLESAADSVNLRPFSKAEIVNRDLAKIGMRCKVTKNDCECFANECIATAQVSRFSQQKLSSQLGMLEKELSLVDAGRSKK